MASGKANDEVFTELFLATLSRFPSAKEKTAALRHVADNKDRRAAFVDIFWALLNTREFILNH